MDPIVNKVSQSGIITLDLSEWLNEHNFEFIDIKEQLYKGIVLKEKDFRSWIKQNDWIFYTNSYVGVYCSTQAIIPTWAYMLISSALEDKSKGVYFGNQEEVKAQLILDLINELDTTPFRGKRVVVKGCGEIKTSAYVAITQKLVPVVSSLMFGEPCSTVPIFKQKKA